VSLKISGMKKGITLILIFVSLICKSQKFIFVFEKPDNPVNCGLIHNGKFKNINYDVTEYSMQTTDSLVIEHLDRGQSLIKSKIEWKSECKYKLTIIENTSETPISIGDTIITEIVETQEKLIKLRIFYNSDTIYGIYERIGINENKYAYSPEDLAGKNVYQNPIDGKTYETNDQYVVYRDGERTSDMQFNDSITGLVQVIFLNSDAEIRESIDEEKLQMIMDKTIEVFDKYFLNSKGDGLLLVQFNISKKKGTEITFAIKGEIDLDKMKQFEKDMKKNKFVKSKNKEIIFQMLFNINNK
jgi:hypothetical protein